MLQLCVKVPLISLPVLKPSCADALSPSAPSQVHYPPCVGQFLLRHWLPCCSPTSSLFGVLYFLTHKSPQTSPSLLLKPFLSSSHLLPLFCALPHISRPQFPMEHPSLSWSHYSGSSTSCLPRPMSLPSPQSSCPAIFSSLFGSRSPGFKSWLPRVVAA